MSTRNEIVKYAKEHDAELRVHNFTGTDVVTLHSDGTLMHIRHAIIEVVGDPAEWVVVYAEHHDPIIHHRDDLEVCVEVERGAESNPVGIPPLRRFKK
jgi:hypothetical protein